MAYINKNLYKVEANATSRNPHFRENKTILYFKVSRIYFYW